MPKMKTHRGAAKRFKKTATGKLKHARAFHSHILTKKSTKRKRGLRTIKVMHPRDAKRLIRALPYL
jgi:large subunit ribosomal protein L35